MLGWSKPSLHPRQDPFSVPPPRWKKCSCVMTQISSISRGKSFLQNCLPTALDTLERILYIFAKHIRYSCDSWAKSIPAPIPWKEPLSIVHMARYYSINLEISRTSSSIGLKALLQAQCCSVHEDHQVGYGTYQMECVCLENALLPIVAAFRFGIALKVSFNTNGMCAKNITHLFAVRKKQ